MLALAMSSTLEPQGNLGSFHRRRASPRALGFRRSCTVMEPCKQSSSYITSCLGKVQMKWYAHYNGWNNYSRPRPLFLSHNVVLERTLSPSILYKSSPRSPQIPSDPPHPRIHASSTSLPHFSPSLAVSFVMLGPSQTFSAPAETSQGALCVCGAIMPSPQLCDKCWLLFCTAAVHGDMNSFIEYPVPEEQEPNETFSPAQLPQLIQGQPQELISLMHQQTSSLQVGFVHNSLLPSTYAEAVCCS
jgi:hypothetical protein